MQSEDRVVNLYDLKSITGCVVKYEPEWRRIIHEQSKVITSTKMYSSQTNPLRTATQHTIGKLGEVGVYLLLEKYGCSKPDIDYNPNPSFDCDLKCPPFRLHVKSVEANGPYGVSFTFQHNAISGRIDDLFIKGNEFDVVICTVVDSNIDCCDIKIAYVDSWTNTRPMLTYTPGVDKPELEGKKLFLNITPPGKH